MTQRILIVDDETSITRSFASLLTDEGYRVATAATAEEALAELGRTRFDLVLLDLNLPGMSGIELLEAVRNDVAGPEVLIISGQSDISTALDAIKLGAIDYLEKPVPPEKLLAGVRAALLLATANRQRALLIDDVDRESTIIGNSPAIRKLLTTIDRAAPTDVTVLLTGENGTGKELAATRLFLAGSRRERPYIKVNCPGIPATLFESELFGHTRGAFTGAVKDYPGKFSLADGGTIFLDEIGDLPLECQAKLLRVLESGEVERLGSAEFRTVDVRVICATNQNLRELVAARKFREDLYYRISVMEIEVPPLAHRREDIPLLVGAFLKRFDPVGAIRFAPDAMARLTTLDYPGNVRQLKNIIERLTIVACGREVTEDDIETSPGAFGQHHGHDELSLAERTAHYEKELIAATLTRTGGNISEAARLLRTDRANLSRRIKEFKLKN